MAKSDLLKEAIADARAVKETALANAKIALQEAFAPRIQRMISDQIENELDSEEELPAEEPALDDMGAEGEEGDDAGVNWVDNDISFEVGGQQYDAEIDNPMGDELEGDEFAGEEMPKDEMPAEEMSAEEMPAENPEEEYNEGYDEMDEDLNLEAIIRELEGDLDEQEEPAMEDPAMEEPVVEGEEAEEDDLNIDEIIESILREEEEGDVSAQDETGEVEAMKEELEEAYNTVRQLKSIINEVNLLNAKLLYTNKLFRNFELTEGQKMKVIENFDRAGNTREVKLVFSTLAESFNRPTKKRVVKESYASKATTTTAPKKETTQVLSEGFELANRWKKLAGLL
jgi:hypothetical protein